MPTERVTIEAPGCGCALVVTFTVTNDRADFPDTPTACPTCGRRFDPVSRFVIDARAEAQWQAEARHRRTTTTTENNA